MTKIAEVNATSTALTAATLLPGLRFYVTSFPVGLLAIGEATSENHGVGTTIQSGSVQQWQWITFVYNDARITYKFAGNASIPAGWKDGTVVATATAGLLTDDGAALLLSLADKDGKPLRLCTDSITPRS